MRSRNTIVVKRDQSLSMHDLPPVNTARCFEICPPSFTETDNPLLVVSSVYPFLLIFSAFHSPFYPFPFLSHSLPLPKLLPPPFSSTYSLLLPSPSTHRTRTPGKPREEGISKGCGNVMTQWVPLSGYSIYRAASLCVFFLSLTACVCVFGVLVCGG